jgi:hypothetical protein
VRSDENAAKDVGEWVEAARRLQQETKATVLTLHHTVKRAAKNKAPAERGSSALRGAADTMMAVTKKGDTLTLSCVKQKDSEEFQQLSLRAKEVVIDKSGDGPQKSLVIVGAEATEQSEPAALTEAAAMALGILSGMSGPLVSKQAWKMAVDAEHGKEVPDRTFMNWVDEVLEAGKVERHTRGYYRLKQPVGATANDVPSAAMEEAA